MPGLGRGTPGTPPGRVAGRGAPGTPPAGRSIERSVNGLLPGRGARGAPGTAPGTAGRGGTSALRSVNGLLPGRGARGTGGGCRRCRRSLAPAATVSAGDHRCRRCRDLNDGGRSGHRRRLGHGGCRSLRCRLRRLLRRLGARSTFRGGRERLAQAPHHRRLDRGGSPNGRTHPSPGAWPRRPCSRPRAPWRARRPGPLTQFSCSSVRDRGRPGPLRRARTRSSLGVHRVLMSLSLPEHQWWTVVWWYSCGPGSASQASRFGHRIVGHRGCSAFRRSVSARTATTAGRHLGPKGPGERPPSHGEVETGGVGVQPGTSSRGALAGRG